MVNRAINFGLKSSLKTVNAKQVSVRAYQKRSIKCSNSAARKVPRKIWRKHIDCLVTHWMMGVGFSPFSLIFLTLALRLTIENKLPAVRGKEKMIRRRKMLPSRKTYSHWWITLRNVHHRWIELFFLHDGICNNTGWKHRRCQENQKRSHDVLRDVGYWDEENVNFGEFWGRQSKE